MNRELVKILRTEGGVEASVAINGEIKEILMVATMLQKLQDQLMQKLVEQAKEAGLPIPPEVGKLLQRDTPFIFLPHTACQSRNKRLLKESNRR